MRHVVMFSGGVGSYVAAKRVAERYGVGALTLLFADTRTEDADTYRFVEEAAADVGVRLVTVADGRDIWDVFRDVRFLGNASLCPASRILKQEPCDAWLAENCAPESTVLYVGIDWSEEHRLERMRARYADRGYRVEAPLCDAPYLTKDAMIAALVEAGIAVPEAYRLKFAHNNCGKKCVRAGIGHWTHVYHVAPRTYAEAEGKEGQMRDLLGDVSILRDRAGGETKPLTLTQLRRRIESGGQVDMFAIGGCGCFVDTEAA